jgi:hypothetical protein
MFSELADGDRRAGSQAIRNKQKMCSLFLIYSHEFKSQVSGMKGDRSFLATHRSILNHYAKN